MFLVSINFYPLLSTLMWLHAIIFLNNSDEFGIIQTLTIKIALFELLKCFNGLAAET